MLRKRYGLMFAAFFAAFVWLLAASAEGNATGKTLFEKRCGGCHALDRDKEGPRLGGVYGRKAGSVDSFQYSDALKKSNLIWSDDTLERWLTDTEEVVPDNEMSFHVPNGDERKAIIAYLKMSPRK